jgi:hypothetical protein
MYKKLFGIMVLLLVTGSASATNFRFQIDISNPAGPIVNFQCQGSEALCSPTETYHTVAYGNGSIPGDFHSNPLFNDPTGFITINERLNGEILNFTSSQFFFATPVQYYFGSIQTAYLLDITGQTFTLKTGTPDINASQKSFGEMINIKDYYGGTLSPNLTGGGGTVDIDLQVISVPEPEILLLLVVGAFSLLAFSGKQTGIFSSPRANIA